MSQRSLDSFYKSSNPKQSTQADRWQLNDESLIVYGGFGKHGSRKVAAFDLDSNLTLTKNGSPWQTSGDDWRWFNDHVVPTLVALAGASDDRTLASRALQEHTGAHHIVIFSNQGGVVPKPERKRYQYLRARVEAMVKELGIPVRFYGASKCAKGQEHDKYRKPKTGMWEAMLQDLGDVDIHYSFFVGDAAGRDGDHSDSDLSFASRIGLKFYTPEEFFL